MAEKTKKKEKEIKLNKNDFTHLHVHSHYSLLDGLGKIDDLLKRAKELGMKALALTDHGVMYGAVEFYKKAKEYGIKPIIGCEMYVSSGSMLSKDKKNDEVRYHLLVLARNEKGYKNLVKLVTESHIKGFYYKPRVDKELLKKHSEGLIASSACLAGEIPRAIISNDFKKAKQAIKDYKDIFGEDNFYLELEPNERLEKQVKVNEGLKKLSKETGTKLIASCDIHYVKPKDNEVQDLLLCIQQNKKVDEKNRLNMMDVDLYMKSRDEMLSFFKDVPEALENTAEIANRCSFELDMGKIILPHFEIPGDKDPNDYLRELCVDGIKFRYGETPDNQIYERLEFELDIIKQMGYASYFLIVSDFVNWAKNQKIVVGPGRGSAAGSIISYLLKITNVDPIKYELLFERFLNPERISMPDIDFADERRDEVLEYVANKYGHDKVAQIITFGTMAARNAIRDAGRALNYPYDFCDKIAKEVPAFTKLKDALNMTGELAKMYENDPGCKKVIDMALKLEGVVRHAGTHACGVVITKEPLVHYTPLQNGTNVKKENQVVTQFEGKFVEAMGLLKMDFLGLRNLTILQNVISIIRAKYKKEYDLDKLSLDDKKTLELFAKGETTGVFQFESAGFKRHLKDLKPSRFQDLIDMVALYRPGPMEWIPDYIAGKHGKRKITFLHPKLKPILEKTYGIVVVQEQVMEIAKQLAGFTAGEADFLRKAMGKKIESMMNEQKEKFIMGCIKNDIKGKTAEKIWDFIKPFAGYGFNWAHSACYAMIGYQTAYFKAYYPVEFMAALLSSDENNTDRISIEIDECRKMNIPVLSPDVNESYGRFAAIGEGKDAVIRYGLNAIKNVGESLIKTIIKERKKNGKFKDLSDFIERIDHKDLNKKSLESLAKSGALNSIATQGEVLGNIDKILSFAKELRIMKSQGQSSLFGDLGGDDENNTMKINLEDNFVIEKKERLSWEKELLGIYVSENPLSDYRDYLEKTCHNIYDLINDPAYKKYLRNQEKIQIAGILVSIKKIFTKNNQQMAFAEIEDLKGKLELIIFPKVFIKFQSLLMEDKIVFVKGKLNDKDGNMKILVDDMGEVTERVQKEAELIKESKIIKPVAANVPEAPKLSSMELVKKNGLNNTFIINLDINKNNPERLKGLIKQLKPGKGKIILRTKEKSGEIVKIRIAGSFDLTGDIFEQINKDFSCSKK